MSTKRYAITISLILLFLAASGCSKKKDVVKPLEDKQKEITVEVSQVEAPVESFDLAVNDVSREELL